MSVLLENNMKKEIIGIVYGISYEELDDTRIGDIVPVVGFTIYNTETKETKEYRLSNPIDCIYKG